jgi:hypothetical protein
LNAGTRAERCNSGTPTEPIEWSDIRDYFQFWDEIGEIVANLEVYTSKQSTNASVVAVRSSTPIT